MENYNDFFVKQEWDKKQITKLTAQLIRLKNTNQENINRSILFCAEWLQKAGVETRVLENNGLKMVVAELKGTGPRIMLNGHVDVVPGNPGQFTPKVQDGKIYGRGSYDMLGSVAAMMVAMKELASIQPLSNVLLAIVPDEEQGGAHGTGYLVEQGYLGDFAVCGEPTNFQIAVQAKGVLHLEVKVNGVSSHGSRPWLGKNAILEAFNIYKKIEKLECVQQTNDFFPNPSFNLSTIKGGKAINQVPNHCSFHLDIRYLPEQNGLDILKEITDVVPEAEIIVVNQGPPVGVSENNKYVRHLKKVTERIIHTDVDFFGQDGSADTRFYAKFGIPAVEFGPLGDNHHGPSEYVEIESLVQFERILIQFINSFN